MANNISWDNVPTHLLEIIGSKVGSLNDFIRFSAVCKTWQSVMSERREAEKALILLSPESPLLLLAEKVQGTLLSCDIDNDEDEDGYEENMNKEVEESEEEEEEESEEEDEDEEAFGYEGEEEDEYHENEESEDEGGDEDMEVDQEESEDEEGNEDMEVDQVENGDEDMGLGQELQNESFEDNRDVPYQYRNRYYQLKISVGTVREIYSLSTRKLYTVDLPEAAGKMVLGVNRGWVLTLGKNFETTLLHPLLRKEISLPTMRVVRVGNEDSSYEGFFMNYVRKAAMSSEVQPNKNVLHNDRPDPIIMIIYGESGYLGFARPGDKVWTKVDVPWNGAFTDIAYHRGKFYSVNCRGSTFACHIDDYTNGRQASGTLIAEYPLTEPADREYDEKYLVESGGDLWLLVRLRRIKLFRPPYHTRIKYRTTGFLVWKLEPGVSEDGPHETLNTWNRKKHLENKAFFIGRNASLSLSSSSRINPNCIYFTDDAWDLYYPDGGGHDMGVYNVESGTIVPHFQGKSIHPVSPPLWYI